MCGITGIFTFAKYKVEGHEPQMRRLVSMMKRRGPDGEGYWSDAENCSLGFRRLSILDLTPAGDQPMTAFDGRYALVFNGEVYNFREIRNQLEAKGIRFKSSGDTEVVLQALVYWGKEALGRFNGMFALAFYDAREKKILLARDHAGIKPLYYLLNAEGLLFASQYDQIIAHPWSRKEKVSSDGFGLYLRFGYIPPPYGMFTNTFMLEPGSWLEIDAEKKTARGKYFEFPQYAKPSLSGKRAFEAVDSAVSNAVKRQLISDVPVGGFLSGGIDSPLIVAKMNEAGVCGLKTFTVGIEGDGDESAEAAAYARQFGVDQIIRIFDAGRVLSFLEDAVASCGEPFSDFSLFPTMLVAKLARENNFKVLLSGDGGDELFWGYVGRSGSVISKAEDFRRSYVLRSVFWALKKYMGLGSGYYNLRNKTIGDWYRSKHKGVSEKKINSVFLELPNYPAGFHGYEYTGSDANHTAQWVRWNEFNYHLGMVLLKVDRASMYHSVEVRVPLLDREVIETALKIDWRSCLNLETGEGKIPLRNALSHYAPHQTKEKKGFHVPMNEWLRGPLKEILREKLLARKSLCGKPLNSKGLEKITEAHFSRREDYTGFLWRLLNLALWEEKHAGGISH